ncbi:phosphotransferase family protein [Fictibacillus barbaricus]|uniref:Aminoglycoside phosphotransferase (APT) family kinase protein n=1 Tax=Fictibacillus barbaricus TaxID=182136 RepID=A0ABU1TVY4_9BACL|nr:phosphotransferase [Fictibacillus barbaricus]MDR7071367.1 aminoglycoside phosphotransferase (APT) family kinase protein [Fictibacillus barbaricus]
MNPFELNDIPKEIKKGLSKIIYIMFPKQGWTSDVGIIVTDDGKFVIKRSKGEKYSSWLKQEIFVLNALSKTNLPVPKVIHYAVRKEETWAMLEFMEGQTLRDYLLHEKDMHKRQEALYQFGKTLAQIHSTDCPAELRSDKPWLSRMLEKAQFYLENYEVVGSRELLEKLQQQQLKPSAQTLIHGDFTIDNVLIKDGEITSIIDWSGGSYGDPRYDIALAIRPKQNAFEADSDLQKFYEGYGGQKISPEEYTYFEEGLYEFF